MHISKVDGMYPVAFKPNNVIFRQENSASMLEYLLLLNLFVRPGALFPEDRIIKIDVNLITAKRLKGSICNRLKDALKNVCKAQFEVYQDNKNYKYISVFESVERNGDIITAVLTTSALEELKIRRTKNFTKIPIGDALKLNTTNQIGIYTLHLTCVNCKDKKNLTVDEIKTNLGIPKGVYVSWSHFRQRVLDPSYTGINKNLGIDLRYNSVKNGNKTIAIKPLKIKKPPKSKTAIKPTEKEDGLFDFASECFEALSAEEQERYKKGIPEYIQPEVALLTAIKRFEGENHSVLKKSETREEFIKAYSHQSRS